MTGALRWCALVALTVMTGCSLVVDADQYRLDAAVADLRDGGFADAADPTDAGDLPDAGDEVDSGALDGGMTDAQATDAAPTDAAPTDTGPADAGPTDAAQIDAGPTDAAPTDAELADAAPTDAAPPDTGPTDAGPMDAGSVDTGPADSGDMLDAGSTRDAEPPDTGPMIDAGPPPDSGPPVASGAFTPDGGLFEGWGTAPSPVVARAVPILIQGRGFDPATLVVTPVGAGTGVTITDTQVSADGRWVALAVRVAVDTGLAAAAVRPVTLELTQNTGFAQVGVDVLGLGELDLATGDSTPSASAVSGRYSRVTIGAGARLIISGTSLVRIEATHGLEVSGVIRVNGLTAGAAGPGGCRGGAAETGAPCGPQSGGPGASGVIGLGATGGGGGANRTGGTQGGDGASAGQARPSTPAIVTLDGHVGSGGGGAGGSYGGAGGGGGLLLASEGALRLFGQIEALGGDGRDGTGSCVAGNAGAGAGAGGVVIVRSPTTEASGGQIDVQGGAGGAVINGTCPTSRGGDGGDGYVRIDGAFAAPVILPGGYTPGAGAVWSPSTPVIVPAGATTFDFTGEANRDYVLEVDGVRPGGMSPRPGNNGVGTISVTLAGPGISRLCLGFGGVSIGVQEEWHCIHVAVLP